MTINYTFKHMEPTEAIKQYATEKTERLGKFFDGRISVMWIFDVQRETQVAHCHLVAKNMDYFGEARTQDLYASIDVATDRIEKQLRKHKEVVKDHLHRNGHRMSAAG